MILIKKIQLQTLALNGLDFPLKGLFITLKFLDGI